MLSYYVQKIYVGTTDVKLEMPAKFSDDDWFGFDTGMVEHLKCKAKQPTMAQAICKLVGG